MKKITSFIIILLFNLIIANAQTWQHYDSLRTVYQEKQNYDSALVYAEKALQTVKEKVGENDTLYANMLAAIFQVNYFSFKFQRAIEYCRKEMEIRKRLQGENSPSYATCINSLALAYDAISNYDASVPLYNEAMNIYKTAIGDYKPHYAITILNLASSYYEMGNYLKAEPLFYEAKKNIKEVFGEKHSYYATLLNSLAQLNQATGQYSVAEVFYIQTMNIRKEVLGEIHPDYAQSLNNLAELYIEMGNYSAAELLLLQSTKILKSVLGEHHIYYAVTISNLAQLYQDLGKYADAEPMLLETKKIMNEVLGDKDQSYATSLNNLAGFYNDIGNYTAAESLYIESKNIRFEVLGERHPDYVLSLSNLASFYEGISNNNKAEVFYIETINIILANIKQNFGYLSEKEKENYLKTINAEFSGFSRFAIKRYLENIPITQNLYNINLATKGLVLNSSINIRNELNKSSDTILVNQYNKWLVLKEEIGRYSQWSKEKLLQMNVKIDSLENIVNALEKQISLKSNVFANDKKNNEITWNQVQHKLSDKDVAIEFFTYKALKSDTTFYCALVLRKEDKYPQMFILCSNMELKALLKKTELYKTALPVKGIKPIVNSYVDDEAESQMLYKLLWKPIDSLLTGKENIYVSLTELMNKISMNALLDDKKELLLNKYNLCFVNSTRQLAMQEILKPDNKQSIVLFGGINYEIDTTQIKNNANNINDNFVMRSLPSDTARGNSWSYLQGTLTEVNNIDKVFSKSKWNTKVYTGSNATEEIFKSLNGNSSPTILHISTHGFFFPEPDSTTYKTTRNPFKTMLNPLWRSGIIFAGANYKWQCKPDIQGKEDGILTAYEVANCNLRNTDLVVLSACESGLGDIKTGEGVYGLQRAFQVAGAKAVIMSLWSVPDKETTELMSLFYESYIKTKNKHDSFRMAQQTMAKKYAPYFWAAFVLVE